MELREVTDPREPLQKLGRKECEYVARYMGFEDIEPGMPKPLMIKRLKAHGVHRFPSLTERGLGNSRGRTPPYEEWVRIVAGGQRMPEPSQKAETVEVDADDLLEMTWRNTPADDSGPTDLEEDPGPEPEEVPLEAIHHFTLRKMCKERGIPWERTDKKADLIRKLRGQDAS